MRLSWYADTGVAVFSIWQGGTCTGTFRLPMADLPRMVEALRRGPHGDAHAPADQLDSPRGVPRPHGRPGSQDTTGQPGIPGHGPGQYGRADYRSGDYDPGAGGHRHTRAHGWHEETRAAYPDDGLPRDPGVYREERGDAYMGEPTGVRRAGPLREDYLGQPGAGGPQEDPLAGGHRGDPGASGYQDDPLGGHAEHRRARSSRDAPRGGDQFIRRYQEDPLAGGYRADPLGSGDPEGQVTRHYWQEPRGLSRRPGQRDGGYMDDPPAGDHPGGPLTGPYPEEPGSGYPAGPPDPAIDSGDYPADSGDYPASSGNVGYSPARPYVAPLPGGTGGPPEGRRHARGRRPADREESDPSPDSFPYRHPPVEPGVRGRGR
jgi:hypothetical protein